MQISCACIHPKHVHNHRMHAFNQHTRTLFPHIPAEHTHPYTHWNCMYTSHAVQCTVHPSTHHSQVIALHPTITQPYPFSSEINAVMHTYHLFYSYTADTCIPLTIPVDIFANIRRLYTGVFPPLRPFCKAQTLAHTHCTFLTHFCLVITREKGDLERKWRQNIDIWGAVVHCVESRQPAQYIWYYNQSQYRIYCAGWPALYTTDHLHLSLKILPSQFRQMADRAAGLSIKSLRLLPLHTSWPTPNVHVCIPTVHPALAHIQYVSITNVQYAQTVEWGY